MNSKSAINQRFIDSVNYLLSANTDLNKAKIALCLNISNTKFSEILNKRMNVGLETLSIIVEVFRINANWLLTGQGDMLSSDDVTQQIKNKSVFKLRSDRLIRNQSVPLYNIEATAGIVTLFSDSSETKPIDYINIPNLPKCDGALYITGDSMYPLLKSGDIIMYKQVHNIQDGIFWGEMYLVSVDVDGDELVTVKYVQKSNIGNEYIKLVSQNQHHQDREVHVSRIRALALVKASIRINSMS